MKMSDPKYKNQGIHVDIAIFTVEDKKIKTLLVKRARGQYIGEWIIPGGAVYNNESLDKAAERELKEKTGLSNIFIEQFHAFGDPKRDPRKRMIAIGYLALVDKNKLKILQKTPKTLDARWTDIKDLPKLAFDHKKILKMAIKNLREKLTESNIAHSIMPKEFTLPELQSVYEVLLDKELDRRNFRRKFLNLGLIKITGNKTEGNASRPANYYKFIKRDYKEIDIY